MSHQPNPIIPTLYQIIKSHTLCVISYNLYVRYIPIYLGRYVRDMVKQSSIEILLPRPPNRCVPVAKSGRSLLPFNFINNIQGTIHLSSKGPSTFERPLNVPFWIVWPSTFADRPVWVFLCSFRKSEAWFCRMTVFLLMCWVI